MIFKKEDPTIVDNCLMDFLDNLNNLMTFTKFRFRTYYIGKVLNMQNTSYSIIEVIPGVRPLSSFIETFPKTTVVAKIPITLEE